MSSESNQKIQDIIDNFFHLNTSIEKKAEEVDLTEKVSDIKSRLDEIIKVAEMREVIASGLTEEETSILNILR